MTGREGDALARDVIATRGFGDAFGHSLGHGLGLEVHEAPRLAPTAEAALPLHAVVTVEPGDLSSGLGRGAVGGRCLSRPRRGRGPVRRPNRAARAGLEPALLPPTRSATVATTADFRNGLVLEIDGQLYPDGVLSAREAGQGRRVRPDQAEEHPYRRGARPHLQRGRAGDRRPAAAAADAVSRTSTATSTTSWTSRPSTTSC